MKDDLVEAEVIIRTFDAQSRRKDEEKEEEETPGLPEFASAAIGPTCPFLEQSLATEEFMKIYDLFFLKVRYDRLDDEGRCTFNNRTYKYKKRKNPFSVELLSSSGSTVTTRSLVDENWKDITSYH
eukprot:PhM_4_TR13982/c2_g3_i6/m.81580